MKKLLLACFLALGIGASAQYNYTADPTTDPGFIFFNNATSAPAPQAVTAACIGNGVSQIGSSTATQVGVGIDLLDAPAGNTNNGQAATISVSYKKSAVGTGTGTFYVVLFDTDPNDANASWNITTVGSVAITATTPATCATLSATIPAGILKTDGSREYAFGYFFVRSGGTTTIITADYKIVQDVVATVPACGSFTFPTTGAVLNGGGGNNFTWAPVPTATGYHLTVGTTSGGSDAYSADIIGGVTSQYVPLNPNSTYYAKLVPFNLNGNAVGCTEITFTTNANVSYCSASAGTFVAGNEIINKVVFADITQSSPTAAGTPGYEDYTAAVAHVVSTKTYPLTVSITGLDASDKMAVWIDYNHNNVFEDSEKTTFATVAASSSTNIVIPSTALLGDARMRINLNYSTNPQSCGTQTYGQVQDYTINIAALALPSCVSVNTPTAAAPTTTLTWSADTMATGYKVYVGTTSGGSDVVNGTLATSTTYDVTGLSRNTQYFAKVVATNSLGDATGCTGISFTTGADFTYCAATHTTVNADRISNVTFADINKASTATTVTGGYEDFTAVVATVSDGGTYPIAITVASGNATDKVKVWIDSNHNGIFEDSEATLLTYVSTSSSTGTINIPKVEDGSVLGNTRMRIRLARQSSATAVVACGNIAAQGRTQDYTLNIVDRTLAVSNVTKTSLSVYPNPFQDILNISDVKGVKTISVNDASGRQVRNLAPSAQLNLSGLKSGLYIVNLHMEDGSVKTIKAIKK